MGGHSRTIKRRKRYGLLKVVQRLVCVRKTARSSRPTMPATSSATSSSAKNKSIPRGHYSISNTQQKPHFFIFKTKQHQFYVAKCADFVVIRGIKPNIINFVFGNVRFLFGFQCSRICLKYSPIIQDKRIGLLDIQRRVGVRDKQ